MCGGVSEFVVSLSIMLCYNSAGKGNINQGLGTSIMISDCLIVTLLSRCFMGEKVTCPQIIGILMILAAVVIISICYAEAPSSAENVNVIS